MKKGKRILSLFVAIAFMLTLFTGVGPAREKKVYAWDDEISWVEVSTDDWETLVEYLETENIDYKISLTDDIDYDYKTSNSDEDSIQVHIKGNKMLNLSGYSIEIGDDRTFDYDHPNNVTQPAQKSTLLSVGEGTTFYLEDVDSKGKRDQGRIFYNGRIADARKFETWMVLNRNIIKVNGGTFNMLSGRVEAGRSKEQWVTHAHVREYYDFSCDQLKTYTGYARNQINGCGIIVSDGGVFNMAGGYVEGRGFERLDHSGPGSPDAAVEVKDGNANIFYGALSGYGGASALYTGKTAKVKVWAGRFDVRKVDKLVIPWQENLDPTKADYVNFVSYIALRAWSVYDLKEHAVPGFKPEMVAVPERTMIYESKERKQLSGIGPGTCNIYTADNYDPSDSNGRTIVVMPADNAVNEDIYKIIEINHPDDMVYNYDPEKDTAPLFGINYEYKYEYESTRFWPQTGFDNELNWSYKVCWNVYDAYGNKLIIKDGKTDLITGNQFNMSKYKELTDQLQSGKSYIVKAHIAENFGGDNYGYTINGPVKSMSFTVGNGSQPEIVSQPQNRSTYGYGREEFLMAKANYASSVKWYCVDDPSNPYEVTEGVSFDKSTGIGSVTVQNVTGEHKYFARFINKAGYVDTNTAYACYGVDFGNSLTSTEDFLRRPDYVTGIEGGSICINNPSTVDYHMGCSHVTSDKWYYYSGSYENAVELEIGDASDANSKYFVSNNRLYIRNLTEADTGYYYRAIETEHSSYAKESSAIYLYVNSSGIANIDGVVIQGFGKIYKGQNAEEASNQLKFIDNRFIVLNTKWQAGSDYSQSDFLETLTADPTLFAVLEARAGYQFGNGDEEIRIETDSTAYSAKIVGVDGRSLAGKTADKVLAIVSFKGTGDYDGYLTPVQDKVNLEESNLTFYKSQEVDMNLEYTVDCPDAHKTAHYTASFEIVKGSLPEGLTLDTDGRIHGTVTAEATETALMPVIKATVNGSNDVTKLTLTINVIEKPVFDEDLEAIETHAHSFGDWVSDDEKTHSRICEGCNNEIEGGKETAAHRFGEYEIVSRSADGNSFTFKKTCIDCGYNEQEVMDKEDGDELYVFVSPIKIELYSSENLTISAFVNVDDGIASTLSYQWEYSTDKGANWTDCTETTAKTANLTVYAGKQPCVWYRCKVSGEIGEAVSEASKVTVMAKPVITEQPSAVNIIRGSKGKFTVKAEGEELTYQWMYSKDNGKTWKNSKSTGYDTATLTIVGTEALNGRLYKCRVTNKKGYTDTAAAKFTTRAVISEHPSDQNVKPGEKAEFSIKSRSTVATYQWQVSKDNGKTWANSGSTGCKTTTLTISSVKKSYNGWLYRCMVTNGTWVEYSNTALLSTGVTVTNQPRDRDAYWGDTVEFTCTGKGTNLTYQWEVSTNGDSWSASSTTGNKTAKLSLTAKESLNGRHFRCKITGDGGYIYTNIVTLTTKDMITAQPSDKTVKSGNQVSFSLTASGKKLSYQWEVSTDNGKTWKKSGATGNTTNSITFTAQAKQNGYKYHCKVTNGTESSISKDVVLKVK
ncbi:MAG: immunoglobulin domain-containing protein [Eubacterium sp.]|nr:immunoglobulin domain-containing protein [Eubacterium sp.]